MDVKCFCGCRGTAAHDHHVVYRQELRWHAERRHDGTKYSVLVADARNIVRVAWDCHQAHHKAAKRYPLWLMPDSVFEFAAELLGAGAAYEYLRRHYRGSDGRLDALIGLHLSGR